MDIVFNKVRPGYKLVRINLEWNVQALNLQTTNEHRKFVASSSFFSSQEMPDSKWKLHLYNLSGQILIQVLHYNSTGYTYEDIVEPVLVKLSILNDKEPALRQMKSSNPDSHFVPFEFSKVEILESNCRQMDGSYTFCCKILSHVKNQVSSSNPAAVAINCSDELATQLEALHDTMQMSDVNLNIRGRVFPAHKLILATRSEVFAAMFQHQTKEQSSNQITIEDVEPEVFQELLRFIYTGRVSLDKMETMAAGLLFAADKYLLDRLKKECENYLLHHMSPENCVVFLLHGNRLNLAEQLKEAAKFFLRFPLEVMATDGWKKTKQENPVALVDIQEFVYRHQ